LTTKYETTTESKVNGLVEQRFVSDHKQFSPEAEAILKKLETEFESVAPKHAKKIVFEEGNSVRRLPMPTGNVENLIPTVYKYHEDDDFLVGEDVRLHVYHSVD
jgi:hypothetical protein